VLPGPIILCSPPHLLSYATVLFKMIFQLGRRCTKHQRRRCYHHSIHWSQSTVNAAVVVTAFCWRCTLASSQCTVHCSSFGLLQLCSLHCTFHSAWIQQKSELRRRTSQGAGEGCSPPDSGKPIIFRAKAKFFGRMPAATFLYQWKKRNSFCLARWSAQNPGFLLTITGWGESGKVILQVSIAFLGRCRKKNFRQGWLSPLENIGPYAYGELRQCDETRLTINLIIMVKNQSELLVCCEIAQRNTDNHESYFCDMTLRPSVRKERRN